MHQDTSSANDPDLAALRADVDRLCQDLRELRGTLRAVAANEWDSAGARLTAAAAEGRRRLFANISARPEKAAGIAFCAGLAIGLLVRAGRNRGDA